MRLKDKNDETPQYFTFCGVIDAPAGSGDPVRSEPVDAPRRDEIATAAAFIISHGGEAAAAIAISFAKGVGGLCCEQQGAQAPLHFVNTQGALESDWTANPDPALRSGSSAQPRGEDGALAVLDAWYFSGRGGGLRGKVETPEQRQALKRLTVGTVSAGATLHCEVVKTESGRKTRSRVTPTASGVAKALATVRAASADAAAMAAENPLRAAKRLAYCASTGASRDVSDIVDQAMFDAE